MSRVPNRLRWVVTGRLAAAGLVLVMAGAACQDGDDDAGSGEQATTTAPPTTTTTEVRLTKEEYIRQGDALCADFANRADAIDVAQDRAVDEPQLQFEEQYEALYRETAARFAALKPPPSDQPTADRINALLQQTSAKQSEIVAAERAGDQATIERLDGEIEALDVQVADITRQYGFGQCPRFFSGPPQP